MPFGKYKDFDDCVRKNSDKEDAKAYCGRIQAVAEAELKAEFTSGASELIPIAESAVFEEVDGRMMATIRVLKSGRSKNRRTYPPSLVKEAVDTGIFNKIQMFIDHNRQKPQPQDRGMREMVSAIESTSWDEGEKAMNARIEFFDRDFYDYAQRAKDYMGVSINALVRGTRRVVAGETFEDITQWVKPRSVDWVTTPAAGGAILAFEDEEDEDMINWSQITLADLKANAPSVYEAMEAEAKAAVVVEPPTEGPTAEQIQQMVNLQVQEAIDTKSKADAEKAEKLAATAEQVREAFSKSGLPPRTQARVLADFEGLEEFNDEAVTKAITEAKEELRAAGAGPIITGMGPSGSGSPADSKEASFSIHESVRSAFLGTKENN